MTENRGKVKNGKEKSGENRRSVGNEASLFICYLQFFFSFLLSSSCQLSCYSPTYTFYPFSLIICSVPTAIVAALSFVVASTICSAVLVYTSIKIYTSILCSDITTMPSLFFLRNSAFFFPNTRHL